MLPKILDLLKQYNLTPTKKLGQNFLLDGNITDKIIRYIPDLKDATVIEIGSGPGALTRSLLASDAKQVYALEFDGKMITLLDLLKTHFPDKLQVIQADAMTFKEESLGSDKLTLVGNLPYNISVPLLFKWLDKIGTFSSLTLMFQKEVADRIKASPSSKDYGILSVMAQLSCDIFHNFDVSPESFYPPPKIWSSVITLVPRKEELCSLQLKSVLHKIVHAAFNQRRKTIRNSLNSVFVDTVKLLEMAEIDGNLRAENLTVEQYLRLSKEFLKLSGQ